MRVCFVPAGYKPIPPTKGGAVETIVNNFLIINEEKKKMDITVLSVQDKNADKLAKKYKNTSFVYFSGNEKADNLYYWFIYRVLKKCFKIILPDYILKYKMMRYLNTKQDDYDWIIFEGGEIECLKCYQKIVDSKKIVFHSHGEISCTKGLDSTLRAYIAVSDYIKQIWDKGDTSSRRTSESYVLKNGISQSNFQKSINLEERKIIRNQFGFYDTDVVIVFVGRIIPEKGVVELLEAMMHLPVTFKLLMVGSANFGTKTMTYYEKKVNILCEKMKGRIAFTGFIHNDKISTYYQVGDISVVPSMFDDPAPLVIIEAMAAGVPIITTGSGGIKEYCDENCAVFVERGDMFSCRLKDAILDLSADKNTMKKMSVYGKERAAMFTDETQYKNLVKLLENMS